MKKLYFLFLFFSLIGCQTVEKSQSNNAEKKSVANTIPQKTVKLEKIINKLTDEEILGKFYELKKKYSNNKQSSYYLFELEDFDKKFNYWKQIYLVNFEIAEHYVNRAFDIKNAKTAYNAYSKSTEALISGLSNIKNKSSELHQHYYNQLCWSSYFENSTIVKNFESFSENQTKKALEYLKNLSQNEKCRSQTRVLAITNSIIKTDWDRNNNELSKRLNDLKLFYKKHGSFNSSEYLKLHIARGLALIRKYDDAKKMIDSIDDNLLKNQTNEGSIYSYEELIKWKKNIEETLNEQINDTSQLKKISTIEYMAKLFAQADSGDTSGLSRLGKELSECSAIYKSLGESFLFIDSPAQKELLMGQYRGALMAGRWLLSFAGYKQPGAMADAYAYDKSLSINIVLENIIKRNKINEFNEIITPQLNKCKDLNDIQAEIINLLRETTYKNKK